MRMFQSVSGHSSEQSVAHYSLRRALAQLESVSDTISNWSTTEAKQTQIFNSKSYNVFSVSLLRNLSEVPIPLPPAPRLWLYIVEKRTRFSSRFSMSVKRWVNIGRKIHWQTNKKIASYRVFHQKQQVQ